jgi:hypothetical protein
VYTIDGTATLTVYGVMATCGGPCAILTWTDSDGAEHYGELNLDAGILITDVSKEERDSTIATLKGLEKHFPTLD